MTDYEPFPTKGAQPEDNRTLRRGVLGCVGCGGLSVAGIVAVLLLFAGMSSSLSGCDFSLDTSPGQGTASKHLPVSIAPTTGLTDGSEVTVTSRAFKRQTAVGVAV